MNNFQTQQLQCADCGCVFDFTAEEQEFYSEKGYSTPKRCSDCRKMRKQQGGGGRSNSRPPRQMYSAVCSACGCETSVPFKPSGDRPIYCSDCYNR